MSNQQPNTASPAQPNQPTQPTQPPRQETPHQDGGPPPQQANNVWAQPSSSTGGGSNGQRAEQQPQDEQQSASVNGFNAAEVKAFLGRDAAVAASYKVVEGSAAGGGRGGGGAWGAKREFQLRVVKPVLDMHADRTEANHMANNQPFFVQLAKQIATMEGGG
ncbi:hypothetical protein LTR85_002762 [Meristemomyces frigidus]|nr:hypothetical protein LTR85_002762 [Meristemomyces frigidus]